MSNFFGKLEDIVNKGSDIISSGVNFGQEMGLIKDPDTSVLNKTSNNNFVEDVQRKAGNFLDGILKENKGFSDFKFIGIGIAVLLVFVVLRK